MANLGAAALLRSTSLFGELDAAQIDKIVQLGYSKSTERGEVLYLQGEPGRTFYLVVAGEVCISVSNEDGKQMNLRTFVEGDVMGEIALIDEGIRTATATVTRAGMVFCLDHKAFNTLLRTDWQITKHIMKLLCNRIRWTSSLLEDSAFLSTERQVAKRILALAQPTSNGDWTVTASQNDLAHYLNITRQSVNMMLQKLQDNGLVTIGHGKVVIDDRAALLLMSGDQ